LCVLCEVHTLGKATVLVVQRVCSSMWMLWQPVV
jgi:hypothetical protein